MSLSQHAASVPIHLYSFIFVLPTWVSSAYNHTISCLFLVPSHRAAFYFKHCPDFCVQSGFSADRHTQTHTQTHIQISCFSLSVWEKRECEPLEYSAHLRVSTLCDQPFSWLHQQQPAQLFHAQLFLKPWKAHPATPHKAGSIILPLCGVYVWFIGMCVSLFFFSPGLHAQAERN